MTDTQIEFVVLKEYEGFKAGDTFTSTAVTDELQAKIDEGYIEVTPSASAVDSTADTTTAADEEAKA